MEDIHNYKNICNRHNKLFNDYKKKQRMLNDLQQRYLSEEGEKYTFYPIINNYIIKYNRPYFPNFQNSDFFKQDPLSYEYFNKLNNNQNNLDKIRNLASFPEDINTPYNYTIDEKNISSKKSIHKKNAYFLALGDNTIENKLSKNNNKYNLSNAHKYYEKLSKNNLNNYYLYGHRTNIYPKINLSNEINLYSKLKKIPKDNVPDTDNIIKKTNSIKTLTNKSLVSKDSRINRLNYKKKDLNNIIKIDIPLEELNDFNYNSNFDSSKNSHSHGNTVNSSCHYLNKLSEINNNNNKIKNIEGLSLKYLIQDEKFKNNSKPKKSKNISKEKTNKIIDNLLNNNKKLKNRLKINIDDNNLYINENPNNIRLKSNKYYCTLEDNYQLINNKNIKTESHRKKLEINNRYRRINTEKSYNNNINSRTITLREKNNKQNKKYNDKNIYNKKSDISKGEIDDFNALRQNKTLNKGNYLPSINNSIDIQKKNITKKIKTNKNLKENIPIPTYHKITILNKVSEAKRGIKNLLMNESNYSKFLNHQYKLKQISDFNQTNNGEINKTEILSKDNKLNTIGNSYSNQLDEDTLLFSLIEKKYGNNKDNIKYNNRILINRSRKNNKINEQINKIDSFGFNGKKIEKNNLVKKKNDYKISNQQFNEYLCKKGKISGNDITIDDFDEKNDLSIQSLSDSKVFEIANTYVDEHVDKTQVSGILTYKRKQSQIPY